MLILTSSAESEFATLAWFCRGLPLIILKKYIDVKVNDSLSLSAEQFPLKVRQISLKFDMQDR